VTFGEVPGGRTVVSSKPMSSPSSSSDQTRLLIVEDVPQVAQYIRGLLNAQSAIKVLDVLSDGGKAVAAIGQLRPDVVLVDALLQGRIKGPKLVEQIRDSGAKVPVIVLTVPQNPVEVDPGAGVHGVLSMPFSGYDLMNRVSSVRKEFAATTASGAGRVISVFAPKGGVGKTTIAFNLAVALGQQEHQTVLIDGSLQFGDLRALLKVPVDAPSILDLPTDRIAESDLADVLWRDPSGIDILLAPPRVEMAEMVNPRDIDKILSLLRRVYQATIIDMSATISDVNLAFLDASDTIVEIVTYDSTTIHNTIAMADTFRSIGYPASKVRYLVNRADSAGGIDPGDLQRALGRIPEHSVVSDGQLVVRSNNEGVPFVLADPNAMVSQDMARTAAELMDSRVPVGAGRR
jgi:pilus assembly protein CpaE